MKISVITPSFNQAIYIRQTIESVLDQGYGDFEHIVVDGGSTDNTVEILGSYPHLKWISEPDKGQADALNKGIRMTDGDIIGWLNSDDYYESHIFKQVADIFADSQVEWLVGNLSLVDHNANIVRNDISPVVTYQRLLTNPDIVRQPCTFFRRKVLEEVGFWNERFYMTMDLDLWVRLAKRSSPVMLNRNIAYFRLHPNQKTSAANTLRQLGNIEEILKREGVGLGWLWRIRLKKYFQLAIAQIKIVLR